MTLSEYGKNNDRELTAEEIELLNELLGVKKNNKGWKPKIGEKYWYINEYGEIDISWWKNTYTDNQGLKIKNIFKAREEAELELERRLLLAQLRDFADENNGELDWADWTDWDQSKYHILYDHVRKCLIVSDNTVWLQMNEIYFSSEETAEKAIKLFGDRIEKYLIFPEQSE